MGFKKHLIYYSFSFCLALQLSCIVVTGCTNHQEGNNQQLSTTPAPGVVAVPANEAPTGAFHNYASAKLEKGDYKEALKYFTIAYERAKKANDEALMAKSLNNIGLTYWKLGDHETAMESYRQAAGLAKKYRLDDLLALSYTNQALILRQQEAYSSAKSLNQEGIKLLEKKGNTRHLAVVYNNHGQIFRLQNQMDSAFYYYQKALNIYKDDDFNDGKSATLGNLAEIYAYRGLRSQALFCARESMRHATLSQNTIRDIESYKRLSDIFERFSMPDSALFYSRKYITLQEKEFEKNKQDKLIEYQGNLGYELQKLQIENLTKQKQLASNRIWMTAGIVVIALLIASLIIRGRFSRIRLRKDQLQADLLHARHIADVRQDELKAYIIDLTKKNNQINELQGNLVNLPGPRDTRFEELLDTKILTDEAWEKFKKKFSLIFPQFIPRVRELNASITEAELRYLVLHHLRLSPKEMANVLGISAKSVHTCKMRLKRKLNLEGYISVEAFFSFGGDNRS